MFDLSANDIESEVLTETTGYSTHDGTITPSKRLIGLDASEDFDSQ
jgi:hypothetical protein